VASRGRVHPRSHALENVRSRRASAARSRSAQGGGGDLATEGYDLDAYEFVQIDKAYEAVTSQVVTDGLAVA